MADNFDQQKLKLVLDYDPETGIFRWKTDPHNQPKGTTRVGAVAGGLDTGGYCRIWLFGESRAGHRLAWLWMTGEWPAADIDHDNLNRADNKWQNLRLATPSLNAANIRVKKTKTWPFVKGVCFHAHLKEKPFRAQIEKSGKYYSLGYHATVEEAKAAYDAKALELFGVYARAA